MSRKIQVVPGEKYGELTVVKEIEPRISPSGNKVRRVLCTCSCDGKEVETDLSELCKHDIIDLSENGERWEGDSLKGQPFGYGCIYDENNQLIYSGFIFEGMKVCYGKNFYGDCGFEEYVGCFYKNMRHGYGKLSDKKKEVIYEGEWVYNQPLELSTICINEMIKEDSIHYKT